MAPMAISNYLGWLIILLGSYPFLLVAINICTYEPMRRKVNIWFNMLCILLVIFLLVMHMNIDIVYGKELLDAWYSNNPRK